MVLEGQLNLGYLNGDMLLPLLYLERRFKAIIFYTR
jgi:hypothetical protein